MKRPVPVLGVLLVIAIGVLLGYILLLAAGSTNRVDTSLLLDELVADSGSNDAASGLFTVERGCRRQQLLYSWERFAPDSDYGWLFIRPFTPDDQPAANAAEPNVLQRTNGEMTWELPPGSYYIGVLAGELDWEYTVRCVP